MKNKLLATGIAFLLLGCAPTNEKDSIAAVNVPEKETHAKQDTSTIAILPLGEREKYIFDDAKVNAELTSADLNKIDSLLHVCIAHFNAKQEKDPDLEFKKDKSDYLIDLKYYKRQYVAVVNSKEKKKYMSIAFVLYLVI